MLTGNFKNSETPGVLSSTNAAYNLANDILPDYHPLRFAGPMSAICELHKRGLQKVVVQLVAKVRQMMSMQEEGNNALNVLLEVLEDAGADTTNLTLCSMRAAQC